MISKLSKTRQQAWPHLIAKPTTKLEKSTSEGAQSSCCFQNLVETGRVSAGSPSKWQVSAAAHWVLKPLCIFAWASLLPPACPWLRTEKIGPAHLQPPAQRQTPSASSGNGQGWAEDDGEAGRLGARAPVHIPTRPCFGRATLPLVSLPPLLQSARYDGHQPSPREAGCASSTSCHTLRAQHRRLAGGSSGSESRWDVTAALADGTTEEEEERA